MSAELTISRPRYLDCNALNTGSQGSLPLKTKPLQGKLETKPPSLSLSLMVKDTIRKQQVVQRGCCLSGRFGHSSWDLGSVSPGPLRSCQGVTWTDLRRFLAASCRACSCGGSRPHGNRGPAAGPAGLLPVPQPPSPAPPRPCGSGLATSPEGSRASSSPGGAAQTLPK